MAWNLRGRRGKCCWKHNAGLKPSPPAERLPCFQSHREQPELFLRNVQPGCVHQHARCNGGNLGWVQKVLHFRQKSHQKLLTKAPFSTSASTFHPHVVCHYFQGFQKHLATLNRSREGETIARNCWGHKAGITKRGQLGMSAELQK